MRILYVRPVLNKHANSAALLVVQTEAGPAIWYASPKPVHPQTAAELFQAAGVGGVMSDENWNWLVLLLNIARFILRSA